MRNNLPNSFKALRNKNEFRFVDVFSLYDGNKAGFPLMVKKSRVPGPVVFLTGVIHGEEVIGMEVIHRIFRSAKLKRGALYAIPVCNMAGLSIGSRFLPYGEQIKWDNLNRSFPGDPTGTPAEKIGAAIFKTITDAKPDLVIDIHADSHNSIPYIIIDRYISGENDTNLIPKTRKTAEKFGVLVCNEEPLEDYLADYDQNSLTGALVNSAKIPAFVVEIGGDYFFKESYVRIGINGIKNILHSYDMLDEQWTPIVSRHDIKTKHQLRLYNITCAYLAGKISYKAKVGDFVQKDEVVAVIEDVFGHTREVIKSPIGGFLISLGDRVLAFPGLLLASLAVRDESPL